MRIDAECVYLRLEPSLTLINMSERTTRHIPGVEIHWKAGRRWERRTFVAPDETPTLAAALRQVCELLETHPNLEDALRTVMVR